MDLCSLEDAFPNIDTGSVHRGARSTGSGFPYVGGTDSKPTREERRAARRKAKRCKGPAEQYLKQQDEGAEGAKGAEGAEGAEGATGVGAAAAVDPDRPAQIRLQHVEAMTSGSVKLYAAPVGQQPLGEPIPSSACLIPSQSMPLPSYFGKGEEDPIEEGEGFANYSGGTAGAAGTEGDDPSYRLTPDFSEIFDLKGLEKAAGQGLLSGLPEPNLQDSWKPMAPGATYTAFFAGKGAQGRTKTAEQIPWAEAGQKAQRQTGAQGIFGGTRPRASRWVEDPGKEGQEADYARRGPVLPAGGNKEEDRDKLLSRIDDLMGRLEKLETKRERNQQHELLLFVGTGLFMLMSLNLAGGRA